jgi:dihydrofolate synthase/folylpolyglutamate synthase
LLAEASKYGLLGKEYSSVNKAIEAAQLEARKNDLIFIGGSTFVVAEIENL